MVGFLICGEMHKNRSLSMKTNLTILFMFLASASAFAQNLEVTGTVTEKATGYPAIGAAVMVKGTSNGTVTAEDGTYVLGDVPSDGVLVFSSIGFATTEIAVEGRSMINVSLETDTELLEEIVVIGYGTAKSKDLTGSISTIKADELVSVPASSPMGALQGKMAGVQIVNSGAPGATPSVRVRGVGSFGASSPLFVVDGMFFDNIDFLDSNNIESVTILKDASAAAIYGVRAANGVVLITTKTGVRGETHLSYDGYVGFQVANHVLKMADAGQYAALMGEYGDLSNVNASIAKWGGSNGVPSTDTDWYGELLGTGFVQNHSLNLTGSGEKVSYVLGASYYSQNGIARAESGYDRYNILLKGDYKPFDWLDLGANITVSNGTRISMNETAWMNAFIQPAIVPVYDENNTQAFPEKFANPGDAGFQNGYFANPVATATYYDSRNTSLRVLPSLYANISFIPGRLKYHFGISQEYHLNNTVSYSPEYSYGLLQNTMDSLVKTQGYYYNTIVDNTLTYTDSWGAHNLTAMIGQSSRIENYRWLQGSAKNIVGSGEEWYDYVSLGDADTRLASDGGSTYRGLSFFGRVSYDYDDRYFASLTFRRDGTSKYQQHWGNFPSIGLGWALSEEGFMSSQRVFDYLKLRASWGLLGNDKQAASAGFAGTEMNQVAMGNVLYPGYIVNNTFSWLLWEKVNEWNAGLSFTSLGGRLTGELDYFNRLTMDAVVANTLPITNEQINANTGQIRNSGVEFQLGWNDRKGDFSYNVSINGTFLKNEVVSIQNGVDYLLTGSAEFRQIMQVGYPMNSFYGYKVTGIYKNQAEVDADRMAVNQGFKPGYLKYEDLDGDGYLTDKDRQVIGSPYPRFTYGGNISLAYKGFDLALAFYGAAGAQVLNAKLGSRNWASSMNFTDAYARDHWTSSNSGSRNPSVAGLMAATKGQLNSYLVQNADFFQIQNIQVGYSFKNIFGKIYARVYLSVNQPFSIFTYEGFTPEVPSGVDTQTYPMAATYSLGARLTY